MGGSSGGQASFQTPTALYGAENNIFGNLGSNTGSAQNNAYSGTNYFSQNANNYNNALQNSGANSLGAANSAYSYGNNAYSNASNVMNSVSPYARQALTTGFDPQNALYARNFAQNQNQANAVNAMSGVAGTPYGAGITNQANENFNLDWADRALQRQKTASETASNLYGAGTNAYTGYYGAGTGATNAGSTALGAGTNAITSGSSLLQQAIADYLAYIQANTQSSSAYTGAVNNTTGAASGATNAINYGNQIGNQSTQGLGSLAGVLGGYLLGGL